MQVPFSRELSLISITSTDYHISSATHLVGIVPTFSSLLLALMPQFLGFGLGFLLLFCLFVVWFCFVFQDRVNKP